MGRGFSLALLALLVVLPASGHASSTRPAGGCQAGDTIIGMSNFVFTPDDVTIDQGGTVCWTNNAGITHTATSDVGDPESFDSGDLGAMATFRFTFNTAGDYPYH